MKNAFRLNPEMMGMTGRLPVGPRSIQATWGTTCNQIRPEKAVPLKPSFRIFSILLEVGERFVREAREEIPEAQSGECWVFAEQGVTALIFISHTVQK